MDACLVGVHLTGVLLMGAYVSDFSGVMEGSTRVSIESMENGALKYMKACHGVAGSNGVRNTLSPPRCRH